MRDFGVGRIATVIGRYFAMDRDKRWDRVQKAYDALTLGVGLTADSAQAAVAAAYARNENDEFVLPTAIGSRDAGRVRTGDAILFFNYRTDRARQHVQQATFLPIDRNIHILHGRGGYDL